MIRLKVGSNFFDQEGNSAAFSIQKGEKRILNKVFYMGKVFVNVIGWWQKGFSNPMWVMTNLPAERNRSVFPGSKKLAWFGKNDE